jgi:hypothetical protein
LKEFIGDFSTIDTGDALFSFQIANHSALNLAVA